MKRLIGCVLFVMAVAVSVHAEEGWIQLFNGKDLTGWTPKIRSYACGQNFANTFRVEDGLLKVRYDDPAYEGKFKERYGHLFYNRSFTNYVLRVEYRFVGEQLPDGPGWARRNNGLMVEGQTPQSMSLDQSFPVSIEVQLLGGFGAPRSTGNLCTPGTNVEIKGKLFTPHCLSSSSKTYEGDQWVTAEVEVRNGHVIHRVNGEKVMEYDKPQYDPNDGDAKPLIKANGGNLFLHGGTVSIQSESAPTDFRKIEIKMLGE